MTFVICYSREFEVEMEAKSWDEIQNIFLQETEEDRTRIAELHSRAKPIKDSEAVWAAEEK